MVDLALEDVDDATNLALHTQPVADPACTIHHRQLGPQVRRMASGYSRRAFKINYYEYDCFLSMVTASDD